MAVYPDLSADANVRFFGELHGLKGRDLLRVIREVADQGTTVIYTSHYMEEAERLCDRIAILDEGQILAQGRLEELLAIVGLGEIVEIRSARLAIDAPRWQRIAGVRDVEIDEAAATTRLVVASAAEALGAVGAMLLQAGQSEARIEVHPVNLERVFLHLTGRELRD